MTQFIIPSPQAPLDFGQRVPRPVSLEGLQINAVISVALPDFPLPSVNTATSFIDFTSNPDGNFGVGPTASVRLADSVIPLTNGDSELRLPIDWIATIDTTNITAVRFRIDASQACTFKCLAIRALDPDWVYAPVDIDTLSERLVRPVTLTGSTDTTTSFPSAVGEATSDWPILWRSDSPPSDADPRPIDSMMVARFNSGTMSHTDDINRISLYFRENNLDYMTQLDLVGFNQTLLDANGLQPDFGEAKWGFRTQRDLDAIPDDVPETLGHGSGIPQGFTQAQMEEETQFMLEREPDQTNQAFIEARLQWNNSGSTFHVFTSDGTEAHIFNVTLVLRRDYALITTLKENTFRAQIREIVGEKYGQTVLDTGEIFDPALFPRDKGRFGWYSHFIDGDASLDYIRPQTLNFAEYRSQPFESITPVDGVQLFAGSSEPVELYRGIFDGPWGGSFVTNPDRSPFSFKIVNPATEALQGFQTNSFFVGDYDDTVIELDIYLPRPAYENGSLHAMLWNGEIPLSLNLGQLKPDTWSHVEISLASVAGLHPPDYFSFVLVQTIFGVPTYWFVDRITVKQQSIAWSSRNAFKHSELISGARWVGFRKALNDVNDGVVLFDRDKRVQMQAKALKQGVQIGQIKAIPKYAELGRLVWSDQQPVFPSQTIQADFSSIVEDTRLLVFSEASILADGFYPIAYHWSFGDGSEDDGPITRHEFATVGTYPVTFTVLDNLGRRSVITKQVNV
jgi:hypothetical protein